MLKTNKLGFTIVELLIVIVVIAILAAITVIAYNGITTRAENTKTINSVSEYIKVLQAYGAENDTYPQTPAVSCLGPEGTKCGNTSSTGAVCFEVGQASYRSDFASSLTTVANSIPAPSTQTMACSNDAGATGMYGGAYYVARSTYDRILYFLKGNQECSSVGVTLVERQQKDDVTRCTVQLPNL